MNILLVEDDEEKRDEIIDFIKDNIDADINVAMSFQSGKKELISKKFDLILLDMSIPTFDVSPLEDGGRKQAFGGRLLLSEMIRRNIKTKVLVITQFDYFRNEDDGLTLQELDEQLKSSFSEIYFGAIPFKVGSEDWQIKLLNKINN